MSSNQSPTRSKVAAQASMRRRPPTTAREPGYGILISLLFHGMILVATYITFHRNFATPEESQVVPVDLVTIADQTNVTAQAPPTPPTPEKMDIPPSPPTPPPEPDLQDVEPAPEPPIPDFKVAKEKPVDEKPPVPTKKQQAQDFNDLLNKLTTPDKPVKAVKAGPQVIQGIGAGNQMTADLADMLRSQIYRCWSPPQGVPDNRMNDLVVDFDLELAQDGRVIRAESPSTNPGNPNSYNLAAALAARNAIFQCAPYRLPPERYQLWREINPLRFDPRQIVER
jgi:outer membrane biosynthesis protein TonB